MRLKPSLLGKQSGSPGFMPGLPLCKKNVRRIQSNKPEQAALAQYAG